MTNIETLEEYTETAEPYDGADADREDGLREDAESAASIADLMAERFDHS